MSEQEARFKIGVDVSGGDEADSLADSLVGLQSQIKADKSAVSEMTAALRAMQSGTSVSITAFSELKSQIEAKKAAIASATESYVTLGGTFGKVASDAGAAKKAITDVGDAAANSGKKVAADVPKASTALGGMGKSAATASGGLKDLLESVEKGGGPLGAMAGKAKGFVEAFGKAGVAGVALAAAAAVVVVTVALVAGAAALAAYAIGAANAARNQRLNIQALEASKPAFAGIGKTISEVGKATGVGGDKLVGFAKQLEGAKVKAKDMPAALRAVAIAEAALGEGAAADLVQQLKDGKKSATELAREMEQKFGGIVKAKLLDIDKQFARAKANVASIFAGVKIEGFLTALDDVLSLLDEGTVTGRALRTIANTMLQPIIDFVASSGPVVKAFFQGLVIGALVVAIGVLKVRNAFRDAFGGDSTSKIDMVKTAMYGGAIAVGLLVAALGLVAGAVLLAFSPFIAMDLLVYEAVSAMGSVIDDLSARFSAGGASAVSALIDGLVIGITGGTGAVGSAMASLAGSAIKSLMAGFDARSPSRKTKKVGGYAGDGIVVGAEDKKKDVDEAMRGLVQIPSDLDPAAEGKAAGSAVAKGAADAVAAEGGASGGGSGGGGGKRELHVHLHGVPGADKMDRAWLEEACDELEEAAARGGVSLEEAA